jgi:chromate transporter
MYSRHREWFFLNLKIGGLSFGSSGRFVLYEDAVVENYKWLSRDEFQECLTIAQFMPGPSLVNLSYYIGLRILGQWAALLGILALVLPGAAFIVGLTSVINIDNIYVRRLFSGFSLASASIFVVFLYRQLPNFKSETRSYFKICMRVALALTVAAASQAHVPLALILLVAGIFCCLVEFGIS